MLHLPLKSDQPLRRLAPQAVVRALVVPIAPDLEKAMAPCVVHPFAEAGFMDVAALMEKAKSGQLDAPSRTDRGDAVPPDEAMS